MLRQEIKQTHEEKVEMFINQPKEKIVEMLIESNRLLFSLMESANNFRLISGCTDCPCCDQNDFCSGYTCNLKDAPKNQIKESKTFQRITPKWCPLKNNDLILKFNKKRIIESTEEVLFTKEDILDFAEDQKNRNLEPSEKTLKDWIEYR